MGSAQNGNGDSTDCLDTTTTLRGTWAVEYPRDHLPDEPLDRVLWACFEYFAHKDQGNAAIHMSPARYSPVTFRLADQLDAMDVYGGLISANADLLRDVMSHRGQYAEDRGR